MPNAPRTPARQIRIGDDWYDFERAAQAEGRERAELVREFIAWYLHRPGSKRPARPPRDTWSDATETDPRETAPDQSES